MIQNGDGNGEKRIGKRKELKATQVSNTTILKTFQRLSVSSTDHLSTWGEIWAVGFH